MSFVFATRFTYCCPNLLTLNGENPPEYSTCVNKNLIKYRAYVRSLDKMNGPSVKTAITTYLVVVLYVAY